MNVESIFFYEMINLCESLNWESSVNNEGLHDFII